MGVLLGTEDVEDIVVLMKRFAKVPSLLLVPPLAVGISECPLHARGVGIVAVLRRNQSIEGPGPMQPSRTPYLAGILILRRRSRADLGERRAGDDLACGDLGQTPADQSPGQHLQRHDG